MNATFSLLIVAVCAAAPIDSRYPGATTAYQCDFEADSDDDFDGWPVGWVRRRGPGYPHYLDLQLSREPSARGEQCFRFDLNGGAAAVSSPPVEYDDGAEYLVEASVKTEGLKHDEAFIALRFLDEHGNIVQSEFGPRLQTTEWRRVRIGPVYCEHAKARQLVVELHLQPGEKRDLWGSAKFDDVWVGKLPRKSVRGSRPYNVFQVGEPIELHLHLTGLNVPKIRATLELFDREGKLLSTDERTSTVELKDGAVSAAAHTMTWKPSLPDPGHYRGRVAVYGPNGLLREDETAVVVVEPIERLRSGTGSFLGDFGWSILEAASVPQAEHLHTLLHESGARRLKYPVWFANSDSSEAREVMRFVERMNVQGVAVIGTLTPRPAGEVGDDLNTEVAAAQTFREPREKWMPLVEPMMFDLAFKVRAWQLGHDRDLGFMALPGAVDRIAAVKKEFDRIEQDAQVGVPWSWLQEPPQRDRPATRFLALTATPEPTADELGQMLDGNDLPAGVQRWVGMSALSRAEYAPMDRVRDLVERMIAAKAHGAEAVFFVDPFSSETGLLERTGTPTELFLPWRTMAAALDGAKPAGSLTLRNRSRNQLFLRAADAVLIVAADEPTEESLELDGTPHVSDLWEQAVPVKTAERATTFEVGPTPLIVTGLSRNTAAWDQALKLEKPQLREIFGTPQPLALVVHNTYDQPVQGKLTIETPPGWTLRPDVFDVSLGIGEQARLPFEVTLPPTGETGDRLLRIEHDLSADQRRQFAVYREIRVGVGDIVLEVDTRIVDDTLEVEQRLVNNSASSVSFRCNLFAPNQRRMRTLINDLPPGIDVQVYRLPDARSLRGRTLWIRAEEQGGNRVLSVRFIVGEDS
jgi:hypothetical protein